MATLSDILGIGDRFQQEHPILNLLGDIAGGFSDFGQQPTPISGMGKYFNLGYMREAQPDPWQSALGSFARVTAKKKKEEENKFMFKEMANLAGTGEYDIGIEYDEAGRPSFKVAPQDTLASDKTQAQIENLQSKSLANEALARKRDATTARYGATQPYWQDIENLREAYQARRTAIPQGKYPADQMEEFKGAARRAWEENRDKIKELTGKSANMPSWMKPEKITQKEQKKEEKDLVKQAVREAWGLETPEKEIKKELKAGYTAEQERMIQQNMDAYKKDRNEIIDALNRKRLL